MEKMPFPFPVALEPSLNINDHIPVAVTVPVILVLLPLQTAVLVLVMVAVGRALTITWVEPVRSAAIEVQLASDREEMVYVVFDVGLTLIEKMPFPLPLAVAPLLSINDHIPEAVTVPVILVLLPLQIEVLTLVMTALGLGLIVNVFVEVALPQGVLPFAVRVRVTLPAEISAELGVYVQFVKELALAKVPVPFELQATDE